jgi:hypothetical protein
MERLRVVQDQEEARFLWESLMPEDVVTDLWEVRGLLPLSWVEEQGAYAFFPG